jgi:uncharacterized protein
MRRSLLLPLLAAGCFDLDGFMFGPNKLDEYTLDDRDYTLPEPLTADCNPELLELTAEDGTALFAVFLPGAQGANGPAILYFHGNEGNLDAFYPRLLHLCNHGYTLMMVDYRGYGRSAGAPSEDGLYLDARAALEVFLAQPGVNPDKVVLYGLSLGGAVAVELAREVAAGQLPGAHLSALVLDSAFSSIQDLVNTATLLNIPAGNITDLEFDNLSKIDKIGGIPLLMMHGGQDSVVPVRLSEKLFDRALAPKRHVLFPGADHARMETTDLPLFDGSLGDFLTEFVPVEP